MGPIPPPPPADDPRTAREDADEREEARAVRGCGIFLSLLLAPFLGAPLGAALGNALADRFQPGASARPHAFEEPPSLVGGLLGMVAVAVAGSALAVRMTSPVAGSHQRDKSRPSRADPRRGEGEAASLWDRDLDP